MRLRSLASLVLVAAALSGCPEERADAKRPMPRDRLPPAMPVQPRPGGTGAPGAIASPVPGGVPTPAPTEGGGAPSARDDGAAPAPSSTHLAPSPSATAAPAR